MAEKPDELDDTSIESVQSEELRARKEKKNEVRLRDPPATCSMPTPGMGEPREAEKEAGTLFGNNNGQDVPNLMENIDPHIQEAQRTPGWKYTQVFTHRLITVKLLKEKEKSKTPEKQEEKRDCSRTEA